MKKQNRLILILCVLLLWVAQSRAQGDKVLSQVYSVYVNGEKVPVFSTPMHDYYHQTPLKIDSRYSFASFECNGPVKIVIVSNETLTELSIRSVDRKIPVDIDGKKALFTLNKNGNFLIERNGNGRKDPLLLFANPPETNVPDINDPDVIYFGAGLHNPGLISLSSNQTLYIDAGAIVTGRVEAKGDNIRICGRGILENTGENKGDEYYRTYLILMDSCRNVTVEGIILNKKSRGWTIVPKKCNGVHIVNVKICGSRSSNDDGIDPVNTQNMRVENCVIRTWDDCLAFKGMDKNRSNCENITVRHCMMWSDRCCTTLLGDECRADFMKNIVIEECFVPYLSCEGYPKKFLMMHAGEEMQMQNIRIENIEIGGEGQEKNFIEMTCEFNRYSETKTAGHIRNVLLKNINLSGDDGGYNIVIRGYDQQHTIESVTFENCTINGKLLSQSYPRLQLGKFVKDINFKP